MQAIKINFYRPNHAYGFFSNFYPSPFSVGKKTYPTAEHYFQSKKFEGHPEEQLVIKAGTPAQAFKLGRNKKFPKRADWDTVKENVMYEALTRKFTVHHDLKEKILQTGDKELVEHTHRDSYWGDGGNGSGKNRLGVLLMRLRNELRHEGGGIYLSQQGTKSLQKNSAGKKNKGK